MSNNPEHSRIVIKKKKTQFDEDDVSIHLSDHLAALSKTKILLDGPSLASPHRSKRKVESIHHMYMHDRCWLKSRCRDNVDDVSLQFLHARPWWLEWVQKMESEVGLDARNREDQYKTVQNVHDGIEALQCAFISQFKRVIEYHLSNYDNITISPAPIDPIVFVRFMERCEQVAKYGIYPRLCFHGTRQQNLPSIHERGLLAPSKLHPEGWYTPAIWTATNAATSIGYTDTSQMFACAVLDDTDYHVAAPPASTETPDGIGTITTISTTKKVSKIEKQHGKSQHRSTRKATSSSLPMSNNKCPRRNVERVGDWVVLIYNELHVCPLLTIEWEGLRDTSTTSTTSTSIVPKPPRMPPRNPNTISEDHGVKTLSQAAGYFRKPLRRHRQVVIRIIKRTWESERREHLDKRSNFFLFNDC